MPLEVTCRTCGRVFTTAPGDVLKGPHIWQHCPACRPPSDGEQVERPPIAA